MKEHDISITFTVEEHEIMNDVMCHVMDSMYFSLGSLYELQRLDPESYVAQRHKTLETILHKFHGKWMDRFEEQQ